MTHRRSGRPAPDRPPGGFDAESEFGIIDIRGNVTVEIRGLTISGGRGDGGAGIASFFTNDFVTLKGVVISGNATTSSGGGAIITGAQMTIDSSTISGNQANGTRGKGGGIYTLGGNLMVTNSTISGNSATDIGGGIFQNGGTVGLMNVTLTGNSAQIGGGFGKEAYPALFIHVTVAGNGASVYGGIYALTGREPIGLVNTIVANNGGGNCGGFGAASITDGGGNLVYPATARCDGIVPATTGDPNLGSLSLNAPGTTATMALGAGSAAIDAAIASVLRDTGSAGRRPAAGRRLRHRRVRSGAIVGRHTARHHAEHQWCARQQRLVQEQCRRDLVGERRRVGCRVRTVSADDDQHRHAGSGRDV